MDLFWLRWYIVRCFHDLWVCLFWVCIGHLWVYHRSLLSVYGSFLMDYTSWGACVMCVYISMSVHNSLFSINSLLSINQGVWKCFPGSFDCIMGLMCNTLTNPLIYIQKRTIYTHIYIQSFCSFDYIMGLRCIKCKWVSLGGKRGFFCVYFRLFWVYNKSFLNVK